MDMGIIYTFKSHYKQFLIHLWFRI
jgi:hypothetical protein